MTWITIACLYLAAGWALAVGFILACGESDADWPVLFWLVLAWPFALMFGAPILIARAIRWELARRRAKSREEERR